jgi:uncharacterized membrane protein HdeD (DUF308 family)
VPSLTRRIVWRGDARIPSRTQALALAAPARPAHDATVQETVAQPTGAIVLARALRPYWWLWLITGILWIVAALVILQFNTASVRTIGIIVGCMFAVFGAEQLALAFIADRLRWLWALFGGLFIVCGIVAFIHPQSTFVALADTLGFLFLVVGVWWTIEAFVERPVNDLWWLGLISGILMVILAFWTSGQFLMHRVYTLLILSGIWALMHGITDIVRAFQVKKLQDI